MGIQTKLMNTIYIILTHRIDYFPVDELINHYMKNQQQRERERRKRTSQGKGAGAPSNNPSADDTGMAFANKTGTSSMTTSQGQDPRNSGSSP